MLKELLSIVRGDPPIEAATRSFAEMLSLTEEMCLEASAVFWGRTETPEQRTALYEKDVRVNKLERSIRKALVSHLSLKNPADVPHCLRLMSLAKDLERLGDYAKNLVEVADIAGGPFPDDPIVRELKEIRRSVEALLRQAGRAFVESDHERAVELTIEGRAASKRCDEVIRRVAASDFTPPVVVALSLGARFYKRMVGHLLNLLSGVIMPLHKLDYFDEKSISPAED